MNFRPNFAPKTAIATIWLLNFALAPSFAFVCPPADEIVPCLCTVNIWGDVLSVRCQGSKVGQKDIDRVFPALLLANQNDNNTSLEEARPLHLEELKITLTNLTTLDLTSLVKVSSNLTLGALSISYNFNLERISGPELASDLPQKQPKIVTTYLELYSNALLNNEGLSNFLQHFNASTNFLAITFSKVTGGHFPISDPTGISDEFEIEFLPGLAALTGLEQLVLNNNNFSYIGGGQFKQNRNLQVITMYENGQPITIGDDAFLLDPPDVASPANEGLLIDLHNSKLTTGSFNGSSFSSTFSTGRPTGISFSGNDIESVEQRVFEQFLFAFDRSAVDFSGNPIQCNSKGRWLKEQRESFENRVLGVNCANDPGYTIFTSDLV